jgi:signal transduction histidine kinase
VPEEIQDRLGDPFFTTKAEDEEARKRGSGTGLGLFMIQRILNRAGGSLELQSEPGDTRFRVNMPLSSKNPEMLDVQPEEE